MREKFDWAFCELQSKLTDFEKLKSEESIENFRKTATLKANLEQYCDKLPVIQQSTL